MQSRPARRDHGFARSGAVTGEDTTLATPGALALRRLANRIAAYTPHDGAFPLRLPGTYAIRLSRMTSEAVYATRPSQFSREYARFFGSAPTKDIARLRGEGFTPSNGGH